MYPTHLQKKITENLHTEKATSRLAFGGINEKSCQWKRAMAVGEQLFQKCHRKFESSLVCMMIAVVEIRYLLLDGNWKAMTLQEVFGMVCTWHFSTYRIRKKVSSTFYRFVLC